MDTNKNKLFSKILKYKRLGDNFKRELSQNPDQWNKFQKDFNKTLLEISNNILNLEETQLDSNETRLYRLKKIFEKRYRKYFLYGDLTKWSYEKPFGYAGDFKIIEDIYENKPRTKGFDRLWDNYFQQMAASRATRERKEDYKKILEDFIKDNQGKEIRILNLASGPAREIKELFDSNPKELFHNVTFDCLDNCKQALEFANNLLKDIPSANYLQKNVIRLALKKDIKEAIPATYDLIYSTGLFDYLDERIGIRLTKNLYELLNNEGVLAISNYRQKYHNPSAYLMEWITEWNLIYRSKQDFEKIFLAAGFDKDDMEILPQKSGVMQYCVARKK